jgi:hypothetical protein
VAGSRQASNPASEALSRHTLLDLQLAEPEAVVEDGAGGPLGVGEVLDGFGHLLRAPRAAQGGAGAKTSSMRLRVSSTFIRPARASISVATAPTATQFTRMPRGPSGACPFEPNLEEVMDEALRLSGYAARARRRPEALQQALFPYLDAL